VQRALKKSFVDLDELYHNTLGSISIKCGSTCVMVLIVGAHIFCANVGDSRAVLSRKGTAVNLSYDHKASRPDEVARINKNDGIIEFSRVGGRLAVTRAFGDFEFKYQIDSSKGGIKIRKNLVISEPEVRMYTFDPSEDEFIVLASDGLFDMFKS
jgi:serine/threonine protein phosphatase PrpC